MSKKHKKVCTTLIHIEHFLILVCTITRCISISVSASLTGVPMGVKSSIIRLKICAATARIKKYQSIIKEKKRKHDKIVLLAKSKLSNIKVLIFKALINSNISHDEFILINNVLKEYDNMK